MKGTISKRCRCAVEHDAKGRRLACRKPHGSWTFVADLGADPTTGRRRQVRQSGFATRDVAQRALSEYLADASTGAPVHDGRMTVGTWLTEWLTIKAGGDTRPTTLRSYEQHVRSYLVPQLGRLRLADLTPGHVDRALRAVADAPAGGAPLSPSTIRRVHSTLRSALGTAKRRRMVRENVAEYVDLPRAVRARVRPWSPAELGAFLDASANHRLGPLFEVMALTGLRRGEAAGLRWDDVDLDRGVIVVRQQLVQLAGHDLPCQFCGGTHRGLAFGAPKTASGDHRVVDLDAGTVGVLLAHRLAQDVERAAWGAAYQPHGLCFAREDGTPLSPERVSAAFADVTDRAGLRRVRLHDLRHGSASLALAAGVPLAVVSKRLGHSTVALTSDTYSHLLDGVGREAAERARSMVPRGLRDHLVTNPGPVAAVPDDARSIIAGRDGCGGGAGGARTHDLTDYESAALTS